jgi:hypothetical protein
MFANGGQATSEGILSGFNDNTEDGYEDRTPENIEIIANNLRGDMRSLDERYLELAQLVGEAAFDTPEEVVALMQTQLGAATPTMGLESLGAPETPEGGITEGFGAPEEGMMQPEMGVAPEGMPEMGTMPPEMGMAPPQEGMMPPVGMADGGIVHLAKGGMPSNWATSLLEGIGKLDDAATARFNQAMQTGAPVTAAGKPIPFVDQSGRMYQPVGGTNPNMASRGMPMPSKFNPLRFATKFGGPAALLGGYAADALLASDANKGTIPGSMFESELGLPYPEVEMPQRPQNFEDMPGTPEQKAAVRSAGFQDLTPRLGLANLGAEPPASEEAAPAPATAPRATDIQAMLSAGAKKEPGESEKSYRDRVKEKMNIYSEFLGSDPEMRKAQALFLLAEAALNVAGAKGRSTGERLATGLKGLPAGMAALGAEAEKERRGVAAAAIQAVENEIVAEKKATAQQQLQMLKNSEKNEGAIRYARYLMSSHGVTDFNTAFNLAKLSQNGDIVERDGALFDRLGQELPGTRKDLPSQEKDIGYLDPRRPDVVVTDTFMPRAPASMRPKLLEEKANSAEALSIADQAFRDLEKVVGPVASAKNVFSKGYVSLFGSSAVGFTDTERTASRNELQLIWERMMSAYRRNESRESVYAQQLIGAVFGKPTDFFTSPEKVIGVLNNVRRENANNISRIDSQLYGLPVKQAIPFGTGAADSPIDMTQRGAELILDEYAQKRPNATLYIMVVDPSTQQLKKVSVNAQQYMQQKKGAQ